MARKRVRGPMGKIAEVWESDTSKAIATVIAVLLIPGAVIAWNYASDRDELEGSVSEEASSISLEDEASEESDSVVDGEVADSGQDSAAITGDREVGGIGEIETLPNTSSVELYTVKQGDTVYKISQKVCEDDSFYLANMYRHYLKTGSTIEVECE